MTVDELIEKLKQFDGSRRVMLGSSWDVRSIFDDYFRRAGELPEPFVRITSDGDHAE